VHYQEVKLLLEHPAVNLLRAQNSAMLLGFLHRTFKSQHRVAIPESQMQALLESYLEELRNAEPESYPMSPGQYLTSWCEEGRGFLRKSYAENIEEPIFELTSGAEKALWWLDQLSQTEFVGTESRLESIFNGLDEILKNTNSNVEDRVRQLKQEIERLRGQIDSIRVTGIAPTYTPVQLNERYARILATARELLSDFRLVEDNFKRIAQDIAEQQTNPDLTRGAIVGRMLDADEALKNSEQGQSFYGFYRLLLATERQNQFRAALAAVVNLQNLNPALLSNSILNGLISNLLAEGEKVMESHQRMSTNLRRVLDTTWIKDRMKVLELIHEIQAAALPLRDNPPDDDVFETDGVIEPFSIMSRPLWQAPTEVVMTSEVEVADDRITKSDLQKFLDLSRVRVSELRKRVRESLDGEASISLEEILEKHPPEDGMLEVIGYIIVALEDPRNVVTDEESQTVTIEGMPPKTWRIPKVIFCK